MRAAGIFTPITVTSRTSPPHHSLHLSLILTHTPITPAPRSRWVDPLTSELPKFNPDVDREVKEGAAPTLFRILLRAVTSQSWQVEDKRMSKYLAAPWPVRFYPYGKVTGKPGLSVDATKERLAARKREKLMNVLLLVDIIAHMHHKGQEVVSHLLMLLGVTLSAYGLSHHGSDLLSSAGLAPHRRTTDHVIDGVAATYETNFPRMFNDGLAALVTTTSLTEGAVEAQGGLSQSICIFIDNFVTRVRGSSVCATSVCATSLHPAPTTRPCWSTGYGCAL